MFELYTCCSLRQITRDVLDPAERMLATVVKWVFYHAGCVSRDTVGGDRPGPKGVMGLLCLQHSSFHKTKITINTQEQCDGWIIVTNTGLYGAFEQHFINHNVFCLDYKCYKTDKFPALVGQQRRADMYTLSAQRSQHKNEIRPFLLSTPPRSLDNKASRIKSPHHPRTWDCKRNQQDVAS